MKTVVKVDRVSKKYRLGTTRTSILEALSSYLHTIRGSRTGDRVKNQELWALREVNFELLQGESVGLLGKNGAGKSTLLKLLAKITRPTSGTIELQGRLSALIELGTGFHPDLSGRENVYLNGTILGLSRNEISRRFDEIVDFSEIERFIDTPIKRYSSGMIVRLGFAVASCIDPDILLVDEVLAVGDASFRQKCLKRIQTLIQKGTSIIFVSHNLYMVQAVCPTSLYIKAGEVKYSGKTSQAIDLYERDLHQEQAQKLKLTRQGAVDSTDLHIKRVEIVDPLNLNARNEFCSDQTVEVRIHYEAYRSADDVNAVVRLVRTDGLTCCMVRTSTDNIRFPLKSGEGIITVLFQPLQLSGGSFYVDARITNANDSIVLASSWSDWFYVSSSALSHEAESGIFVPNRKWSHIL